MTTTLTPGDVWTFNTGTTNRGPIWADADDSTFALASRDFGSGTWPTLGWLPASTEDPAQVTGIGVNARLLTSSLSPNLPVQPSISWTSGAEGSSSPFLDLQFTGREVGVGPEYNDYSWTADASDYANLGLSMLDVATRLTQVDGANAGPRALRFAIPTGYSGAVLVAEASLTLYTAVVYVPEIVTGPNRRHFYPR